MNTILFDTRWIFFCLQSGSISVFGGGFWWDRVVIYHFFLVYISHIDELILQSAGAGPGGVS